jgi:YidC/Oxa1 family membrane protein insertase
MPWHDFGLAIILLTLVIRFILYPLSVKAVKSQKALQKIQPMLSEVQKKYKDDKEKQAKEILDIYKREKINPFSGLLLAFIQIPILIALYRVFWDGINPKQITGLYSFVANPGTINSLFLGFINLSKPNLIFAILAALAQYFQSKMLMPKLAPKAKSDGPDMASIMQKQMTYFLPAFTFIILIGLPSALGLYWTISGLFSIIQQYLTFKKNNNDTRAIK